MDPPTAHTLYELLVSLLLMCPQTVEILPGDGSIWMNSQSPEDIKSEPSFFPFLYVEDNLGIPQKILYKVYLHAVSLFKSAYDCVPMRLAMNIQQNHWHNLDASLIHVLVSSSSVLLLANPSYQTALNTRKHLVRMHLIDPGTELRFSASLLSSQHCAKSAELWHHRRWLLSVSYDPPVPGTANMDSRYLRFRSQEALQHELELISRACELYPRNYFAWTHRWTCMQSLLSGYLMGIDTVDFILIFGQEIAQTKRWIDCHVSDYSAMHFVLTLSQAAFRSGNPSLAAIVIAEDLLQHAISLVQEYPTHEALWIYVRTALSIPDFDLWQAQTQQFVDHFVQPLARSSTSTGTEENTTKASQYARQFLHTKNKFYLFS